MTFYGKFEIDNQNKIYRTKTFLSLEKLSRIEEPKDTSIIGTIFMLNPGSSRPLGSDSNNPFKNYDFNKYVALEMDPTMLVFHDVFKKLQENNRYLKGVIEIKNLFNYREDRLSDEDWAFLTENIRSNSRFNIEVVPSFFGEFVFFAWGTSKLKNTHIKQYAKSVFNTAKDQTKNIMYISSKSEEASAKQLSFYHPLGGYWKADKRERFNKSLFKVFASLEAKNDFA